MKLPILETEFLCNPHLGYYLVTTWYDDGTVEERMISKGKMLINSSNYDTYKAFIGKSDE